MFFTKRAERRLDPAEAHARGDLQIVDVRSRQEWTSGHIPKARHIPLDQLQARLAEIDRNRPVAFICQSGVRSRQAARLARRAGLDAFDIAGGMRAWVQAGLLARRR